MIRLIFMIFHIKYTFHQFDPVRTPVRSIFDSHCVIALRILVTIRALNHSSDTLSFTIFPSSSSSSSSFILPFIHFNSVFRSSLLRFSNAILSTIFLFHIEFLLKIIEWNVISASNKHENTNINFFHHLTLALSHPPAIWNPVFQTYSIVFGVIRSATTTTHKEERKYFFFRHVRFNIGFVCHDATKYNNVVDKNCERGNKKKRKWEKITRRVRVRERKRDQKIKENERWMLCYTVTNFSRIEWKMSLIFISMAWWRVSFPVQ